MNDQVQRLADQAALWNGPSGQAWVEAQPLLDTLFRPIEQALVASVDAAGGGKLLDVGCGTGATTLALARLPDVRCTGLDISEPMIALARRRAEAQGRAVAFITADAQRWQVEPGSFDLIVSRFGLMFFDDPVAAFVNLRKALRPDGSLIFYAWRSPSENEFMTTAERAAAPLLPELQPRPPGAPGQFAFADPARTKEILGHSGWDSIEVTPIDFDCHMSRLDLDFYVSRLGPLGTLLATADQEAKERVLAHVRPAFAPFLHGDDVRFTAACWQVTARRPANDRP